MRVRYIPGLILFIKSCTKSFSSEQQQQAEIPVCHAGEPLGPQALSLCFFAGSHS